MTPPGTSDVARTSVRVTAASGRDSEASTTATLPLTTTGASRLTSPRSDERSGATTPTTPVGSGIVKLKYEPDDRVRVAEDLADLVGPAGIPDPAIDRAVDGVPGSTGAQALARGHLGHELVAPALHQLGDPVEDLAAVHRRSGGPRLERLARDPDRVAEVLARGPTGVRERLAAGRLDDSRSGPIRSAGTPRRCTACTSCGRRSGPSEPGRDERTARQRSSSRT